VAGPLRAAAGGTSPRQRPIGPSWQEALGDPRRITDWTAFFCRQVATEPWRQVLGIWWPRLLPGAAAAATHAIIRAGPGADGEVFARAVAHGDEHVIKFADTAAEVHARTGNPAALAAAVRAVELIPRPA
jgi:hypothetical protein